MCNDSYLIRPRKTMPPPWGIVDRDQTSYHCRLCDAKLNDVVVELGMSPPCEAFINAGLLDEMEPHYPLKVYVCHNCSLMQIREYVAPKHIFNDYAYFSSYSTSWVAHAYAYCAAISDKLQLGSDSLVVEVASNDGYLLQHFLSRDIPVLGIEPAANVAQEAVAKGIPTEIAFFGRELAEKLAAAGQQADLVVGNNVLAQVPDLNDFVGGLAIIVKQSGVITLEIPHLQQLLDRCQFDTIYHEHYSYFSLSAICLIAELHGLVVFDVEELSTHGGSLRVYLAPLAREPSVSAAVTRVLEHERDFGLCDPRVYRSFADQVRRVKRDLLAYLIAAKNEGRTICGYGAPGKGNTLLNYCGVGTDFLDFTVDRNPHKHGLFTPGMHIPIRRIEALYEARPDDILILPWNLKEEIMDQLRDVVDWDARFIIPIPNLEIIQSRRAQI